MSVPPRVRPINVSEAEHRPILAPAGNKARSADTRKPISKPQRKPEKQPEIEEKPTQSPATAALSPPPRQCRSAAAVLRQLEQLPRSNLSMSASCSSDASSDSSHSRASTGRVVPWSRTPVRRKQCGPKTVERVEKGGVCDSVLAGSDDASTVKKRCAWVTPNTDHCYAAFHDEEWGVPVHDDKKLFELLILSGALAELSWPAILNKRHIFRDVFLDFDPVVVSKLNEKKIATPGSPACSLLSELKLRAVIENARQMCKIVDEFGSFDKYIWSFVNYKPIASRFRNPRQVPVKTPKADFISKDLVRRGFRCVGPTVVYSFMQAAGITNDHLISCFRCEECISGAVAGARDNSCKYKMEEKEPHAMADLDLARDMDDFCFSSE